MMNLALLGLKAKVGISNLVIGVSTGSFLKTAKDTEYSWIGDPPTTDVFGNATKTAQNVGKSAYSFLQVISIIALLICGAMCGIGIMMSKSGGGRDDNKKWLLNLVIGGAIVFGIVGFIGIIVNIGNSLNTTPAFIVPFLQ